MRIACPSDPGEAGGAALVGDTPWLWIVCVGRRLSPRQRVCAYSRFRWGFGSRRGSQPRRRCCRCSSVMPAEGVACPAFRLELSCAPPAHTRTPSLNGIITPSMSSYRFRRFPEIPPQVLANYSRCQPAARGGGQRAAHARRRTFTDAPKTDRRDPHAETLLRGPPHSTNRLHGAAEFGRCPHTHGQATSFSSTSCVSYAQA